MEDQRDLISNHEQQPMLGGSTASQRSCNQGAFYTGFSVLMALLIAGQAATIYFVYQQQGRLDKLTVTSRDLQLEALKMKLPKNAMPVSKLRLATPLLMRELEPESLPSMDLTKIGNSTTDQVKYLLQRSDPRRSFPDLTKSFQENLKHLKSNMDPKNWKTFENWMHQWLLFEMSKKPKEEKTETYQKEEEKEKHMNGGKTEGQAFWVADVDSGSMQSPQARARTTGRRIMSLEDEAKGCTLRQTQDPQKGSRSREE